MTINKTLGQTLSFKDDIEVEFGANSSRSLGKYRSSDPSFDNKSPTGSSLSNLPLDAGIPTSGQIKFSDFYGKKLNMVVDYFADNVNLTKQNQGNNTMAATWRYQNQSERVKVVGGFRSRPLGSVNNSSNYTMSASDWQGGKKIIVNINQTIGGKKDGDQSDVALRTGVWPTGTELQVDVGPSGYLTGSGGDGGAAGSAGGSTAGDGGNGTSALGVEYAANINVASGGAIRCGYAGGGGGSGASNDPSDKSTTDFGRGGAGGGGGAGRPIGFGGSPGQGGFNGPDPKNGGAGNNGSLSAGGSGGSGVSHEGATGGKGGDGGDINDAPQNGTKGARADDRAYRNTPGQEGSAGSDGKAIYFRSSTIESNSTIDPSNAVDGRAGGKTTGNFN